MTPSAPTALSTKHGTTTSYTSRLIRLNFLAPKIVEVIVEGWQPAHLDAKELMTWTEMPMGWEAQLAELASARR